MISGHRTLLENRPPFNTKYFPYDKCYTAGAISCWLLTRDQLPNAPPSEGCDSSGAVSRPAPAALSSIPQLLWRVNPFPGGWVLSFCVGSLAIAITGRAGSFLDNCVIWSVVPQERVVRIGGTASNEDDAQTRLEYVREPDEHEENDWSSDGEEEPDEENDWNSDGEEE